MPGRSHNAYPHASVFHNALLNPVNVKALE